VGDPKVGKTNLVWSYQNDEFVPDHVPTVFDRFSCEITVQGTPANIEIWDLSGSDEHLKLRKFAYSKADAIIMCFSFLDPESFENVRGKWLKEIKSEESVKQLPIVLVGTKSDECMDFD